MFKVDIFMKNRHGDWIVSQTRFDDIETAESVADILRVSLYRQMQHKEIQNYRCIVYNESEYINAE